MDIIWSNLLCIFSFLGLGFFCLFVEEMIQKFFEDRVILIKQDACEAPRSPCGEYEQNSFADGIFWADVGNDL